jgi:geranylgeranyl pyrophosphate synthase
MLRYRDEAMQILAGFEQNEANNALKQLVLYTTDRKY